MSASAYASSNSKPTTTFDQTPADRSAGPNVLIVDDDPIAIDRLRLLCQEQIEDSEPLNILTATTVDEALRIIAAHQIHVLLLDKELKTTSGQIENGIEAIPEFHASNPGIQILVVTASKDFQDCVLAMRLGASGFVVKDYPDEIILKQILRFAEIARLTYSELRRQRLELHSRRDLRIPGESPAVTQLYDKLQAVSETNRPVLLTGETGTGKTTAAKIIHELRKQFLKQGDRPLMALNIAAINSNLVESELFGHERGAFTDAKLARPGYIELANSGTLFLDEIGEASLELQAKLLKVLDEGKFYRVGGTKEMSSSFKLICATNRDLEALVQQHRFREDLYMRISTFTVRLPALHERPIDIPEIIRAVLPKVCSENNLHISYDEIPKEFIIYLQEHPFPGNIRGIERMLSQLLVYAPRNTKGRPEFGHWKRIPGLYNLPGKIGLTKSTITLTELRSRSYALAGDNFPGLLPLLDEIGDRICGDTFGSFPTLRAAAKALKIAPSTLSERLKKLELRKKAHHEG